MLGIFPFMIMFLVTSIAMLRERTTGTLERLLTTPLGKLDLLFGYGIAFGLAAAVQAAVAAGVAYWVFGLDTAGSTGLVILIAVVNAVLGVALGLFCSAFARTEFQAVQFMPVVVVPQILLCGLFVARGPDGRLAAGDQRRAAAVVRGRGAAGGRRARRPDRHDVAGPGGRRSGRRCWRWSWPPPPCAGAAADRPPAPAARGPRRRQVDERRARWHDGPAGGPATRTPGRRSSTRPATAFAERGFDGASIRAHRRPPPGSTRRWCTTTSAPRTSCSWPR